MQGIIESLSPEQGDINWKWVGSVFVFYLLAIIAAVAW